MVLSKLRSLLALALFCSVLTACAPRVDYRGAQIDEDRLKQVEVGVSTEPQVNALLGSPSTTSTFQQWGTVWYYISSETEAVAFMAPELIDQQVLAILFGKDGKVSEIKRYGIKDGRQVAFVSRETPTKGKDITLLEQLLGNFGRFNNQNSGR